MDTIFMCILSDFMIGVFMAIQSPCTRHCGIIDGFCAGCGRTVREIRIWSSSNDETKREIIAESSKRKSSMQELRERDIFPDTE
jgi:predicted Fe-S protein YdhL (DUF1289 family)